MTVTHLPESLYIRVGIIYRTAQLDETVTLQRVRTSALSITVDQWPILKEGQTLALTGSSLQGNGSTLSVLEKHPLPDKRIDEGCVYVRK